MTSATAHPERDAIRSSQDELLAALADAGADVSKPSAIRCPFHDDTNPSAGIYQRDGIWRYRCHGCDAAGGVFDIRARAAARPLADVLKSSRSTPPSNGKAARPMTTSASTKATDRRIVETYDYTDPDGRLLFQVVRFEPKGFAQRRPNGNGWTWNMQDVQRILYRLPDILGAPVDSFVFACEGEKDCDRLAAEGVIATTNPGGAGKWHHVDDSPLHDRHIVVVPDNDDKGRSHAEQVAQALHGRAAGVRVLHLPDLPNKGDVSDWLDAGGDPEQLVQLAEQTPTWTPTSEATTAPSEQHHKVLVADPSDPMPTARTFIERHHNRAGVRTLHHHRGAFHGWDGACYPAVGDDAIRAALWHDLEHAERPDGERYQPTKRRVDDVLDALRAAANLPATVTPPAWLDDAEHHPADEYMACRNGLLHLPSGQLEPASPRYFTPNAVDYNFDPNAGEPVNWLAFLRDLWGDDHQSIEAVQDWFGYCLTPDTAQQKVMLLVGPKRSGKGTIGRVMAELVGPANTCAPTLAGLATNFGLQPLIDKRLAIIADARLSARADQATIAERLLTISGEDSVTIDRKHREAWTGKLGVRFTVMTNELPRLADASNALASRFIVLMLKRSFYGQEDHQLADRLMGELPAILNWSIVGYRRLRDRGRFVQPESAGDAIQELEDLGSPVSAFIRERCIVQPGASIECSRLYGAWRSWAEDQGRTSPGTQQSFGRDLRAAQPGIVTRQTRVGGIPMRLFDGIELSEA